jgi:hypothetical protein
LAQEGKDESRAGEEKASLASHFTNFAVRVVSAVILVLIIVILLWWGRYPLRWV